MKAATINKVVLELEVDEAVVLSRLLGELTGNFLDEFNIPHEDRTILSKLYDELEGIKYDKYTY